MPLRPSSRQVWSQDHLLTPVNSACSLSPDNATPAVLLQGSISRPGWPAPTPSQRPSHWQSVPWGLWTVPSLPPVPLLAESQELLLSTVVGVPSCACSRSHSWNRERGVRHTTIRRQRRPVNIDHWQGWHTLESVREPCRECYSTPFACSLRSYCGLLL